MRQYSRIRRLDERNKSALARQSYYYFNQRERTRFAQKSNVLFVNVFCNNNSDAETCDLTDQIINNDNLFFFLFAYRSTCLADDTFIQLHL